MASLPREPLLDAPALLIHLFYGPAPQDETVSSTYGTFYALLIHLSLVLKIVLNAPTG